MIIKVLKKIYTVINYKAVNRIDEERMPYKLQMEYLKQFPEPKDDFERSFFKYNCFCEYCYFKRKWILAFYNIGSLILLPFVHAKLRKANKHITVEKVDAVVENVPRLPNADILPEVLLKNISSFKEIKQIDYSESLLSDAGEEIYKELKARYFFHFYFRMIVLQKLGQFSSYLERYKPTKVVFYGCEREFSGPIQTLLCEQSGSEYVSFMHGDYLSTLSFAFQRYSVYYVWEDSYKKMFEELRCNMPMPVYRPNKLKGITSAINEEDCSYFATYYFSDETSNEVTIIHKIFEEFENKGLRTKIRPHPRFSDSSMLRDVFNDIDIEDPYNCGLGDSITKSLFAVGLNTTVLSEAFFSGKKIVINDVSNWEKYNELKNRGYVMIERPHILLSDLKAGIHEKYGKEYGFYKY